MSWYNAKYTNGHGEYEVTFGTKYPDRAKAVEKVCRVVIDKEVKHPDDISVVVRCKDCEKYNPGTQCCKFWPDEGYRHPDHFCAEGKRRNATDE